jgi:hypothetical protein
MKQMTFNNYPTTGREDIVTFSEEGQAMLQLIDDMVNAGRVNFHLKIARITDTDVSVSEVINFFSVSRRTEKDKKHIIDAYHYTDHFDEMDQLIPIKKEIRLDNPFGEIPILPGYEYPQIKNFLKFGEGLEEYQTFMKEVRESLISEIGNEVRLVYKNDDGTFSVIEGKLIEVNRSNFLMEDYKELLVKDNKTFKSEDLARQKNHRFISENGYLMQAGPAFFKKTTSTNIISDEGETFSTPTWNFILPVMPEKKEEVVA